MKISEGREEILLELRLKGGRKCSKETREFTEEIIQDMLRK